MKNRLSFAVFVLLLTSIFACKKFDPQPTNNGYYLRAQKNNSAWEATQGGYFISSKVNADTLTFFASKSEEQLIIVAYKNSKSQYQLDSAKTKFYTSVGLDVIASTYQLAKVASDSLSLNIASLNQAISGKFALSFKKVSGNDSFPATVVFSQGAFILPRANVQ